MIKLYKERYEVEDTGRVWCLDYYGVANNRKEILPSTKTRYPQVGINHTPEDLHRILAILFIPNPDSLPMVNHKDGNKYNYSLNNLEWATGSDNNKHAIDNGLVQFKPGRGDKRSKEIHQIDRVTGEIVGVYYGTRDVNRKLGIDRRWLMRILGGDRNLTEAHGYYWKYAEL